MTPKNQGENESDVVIAHILGGFAQRISRRGILARLGRTVLGAMGVSLITQLPLDRTSIVQADGSTTACGDWRLCGMCGHFCTRASSCCGGAGNGGDIFVCPACTSYHAWWAKCCTDPSTCTSRTIRYSDCCGGTDSEASGCTGGTCFAHCPSGFWCNGDATYRCTVISIGLSC